MREKLGNLTVGNIIYIYIGFNTGFNENWNRVLLFLSLYKVCIIILGESFEIQFLAIFYIDLNKGFNEIWNQVFIFMIIGTLIQNTP